MSRRGSRSSARGPSGLFAAAALVTDPDVRVDIFDRLPTPFGLLRYGVAPDHASIKAVADTLARGVRVRRGSGSSGWSSSARDVTAAELLAAYDAVIYAVGAADDRRLGIPGEDLPGQPFGPPVRRLVLRAPGRRTAAPGRRAGRGR